ncbi:hypothetical protein ACIBK9_12090 [Nonomuraea sp. NPDC050227]|uniref:hypothetical protein n=1 Tax=Nonomuraea sp. NPDC050227 TaxID=3364360 RepID=UPI0037B61440
MWFCSGQLYAARGSAEQERPAPPDWVRPDGSVDLAAAPSQIPVYDSAPSSPSGRTLAGHVPVRDMFAPPSTPPSSLLRSQRPLPAGVVVTTTPAHR